MPTTLPRSQVTHTPEVRHALDVAARRWPDQKPGALLVRLIEEGARSIEDDDASAGRAQRIRDLSTRYAGVYGEDYLTEVREGWDE
jgi:hypothetical protein